MYYHFWHHKPRSFPDDDIKDDQNISNAEFPLMRADRAPPHTINNRIIIRQSGFGDFYYRLITRKCDLMQIFMVLTTFCVVRSPTQSSRMFKIESKKKKNPRNHYSFHSLSPLSSPSEEG